MAKPRRSFRPSPHVFAAVMVLGGGLAVALAPTSASSGSAAEEGSSYSAKRADSLCGLDDVLHLSNPARVRYTDLMDATSERERIRRERIDPASPLGQILESQARRRASEACRAVMTREGYCSVWKKIRRSDGHGIADITSAVLPELARLVPEPR